MENKERFLSIYREHIHREGSEKILDYLLSEHSDFFRAPASTRFHGAHAQGLLEHSLNAVSYTHLDVYKRQVPGRRKWLPYVQLPLLSPHH